MDSKITFSDICDDVYKVQQKRKGKLFVRPTQKQRTNFLSKNIKYLNEMFKALEITDYMKYIKPGFNMNENGYEFPEKSRGFLVDLFDKYTEDNVLELRRGHFDKVSDRCIVWIVEGMYRMFMNNEVPKEELNQIGLIMSNLTDYPVRLRYGKVFQMTYDLEQLASRAYLPKWRTNLSGNDKCVWLDAMEDDMKVFIKKWQYIYYSMGEDRQMEVNEIQESNIHRMTPEYELRAVIDFAFAEKIGEAMRNDEKLVALEDELNKEIVYKKTGYHADKQDSFEYMKKRIYKRQEEIQQEVFDKYCKDVYVPPEEDIVFDSDFENMKSSKEILEEAIKDYQESLIPFPKLELPDIDIDAVIAQFKMEQNLKREKEQ